MEQPFVLSTNDNKKIYGIHHVPSTAGEAALVIIHGLTGHMNEFFIISVARYLATLGISVFRFNQYDDQGDARRFHETTISTHVADARQVVRYAQSLGYNRIALAGHSLGGPVSIAATDSIVSALLLWDPTSSPAERIKEWETRDVKSGVAFLDWDRRTILGENWIKDAKGFPDSFDQIASLKLPIKIVAAEEGGMLERCDRYRKAIGREHEYVIVPAASHTFVEEGAAERVAVESSSFLFQHL